MPKKNKHPTRRFSQPEPAGWPRDESSVTGGWAPIGDSCVNRHHTMRLFFIAFCAALAGCSQQPSASAPASHWYSLSPNEKLVSEVRLDSQQATNILVQSTGKITLGFKSDVPVSYAAQNRDTYITLKSANTFGRVSGGIGAATRFDGSPDGIHLVVSSDFPFPVRVAIYQEAAP